MAQETILIVDDEQDIRELVAYNLKKEGYQTLEASTGEEALRKAREQNPDLILLDLMLPGVSGLDVMKRLKADPTAKDVLVIMLTAKGEEADIVTGLELGADDYITKPFSNRVVIARIRAVIRRRREKPQNSAKSTLKIRDLQIHQGTRDVLCGIAYVDLTYTEFQILAFLCKRPGWVFTRTQIVDAVRGNDYPVTDRSVDVQISGLRKKLGACGKYIETVRGVGYRIKGEE